MSAGNSSLISSRKRSTWSRSAPDRGRAIESKS
jgi:hypothetical protein